MLDQGLEMPRENIFQRQLEQIKGVFRYIKASEEQRLRQSLDSRLQTSIGKESGLISKTKERYLKDYWSEKDFNIFNQFKNVEGPIIEIGGSSFGIDEKKDELTSHYELFPYFDPDIRKRTFTSDIKDHNLSVYELYDEEAKESVLVGKLDIIADATHLPFKENSLGGMISCGLPTFLYPNYIFEASKSLKKGGILALQSIDEETISIAKQNGFKLMQYVRKEYPERHLEYERVQMSAIFMKKE